MVVVMMMMMMMMMMMNQSKNITIIQLIVNSIKFILFSVFFFYYCFFFCSVPLAGALTESSVETRAFKRRHSDSTSERLFAKYVGSTTQDGQKVSEFQTTVLHRSAFCSRYSVERTRATGDGFISHSR